MVALAAYTAIWRKGCTPPDALDWNNYGNNKAFLEQRIVMTTNTSLSIPNAVKATRPVDYDKNVVTLEWPSGAHGQPPAIVATTGSGVSGSNSALLASEMPAMSRAASMTMHCRPRQSPSVGMPWVRA